MAPAALSPSAMMLKELKKKSGGAPFSLCRDALQESGHNLSTALEILRAKSKNERLSAVLCPSKKSGIVALHRGKSSVASLRLLAQTDFAARSGPFFSLAAQTTEVATEMLSKFADPSSGTYSLSLAPSSNEEPNPEGVEAAETLFSSTIKAPLWDDFTHRLLKDVLDMMCLQTSERITLDHVAGIMLPENGAIGTYIHTTAFEQGAQCPNEKVGAKTAAVAVRCPGMDGSDLQIVADALAVQIGINQPALVRGKKKSLTKQLLDQEFYLFPRVVEEAFKGDKKLVTMADKGPSIKEGLTALVKSKSCDSFSLGSFFLMEGAEPNAIISRKSI